MRLLERQAASEDSCGIRISDAFCVLASIYVYGRQRSCGESGSGIRKKQPVKSVNIHKKIFSFTKTFAEDICASNSHFGQLPRARSRSFRSCVGTGLGRSTSIDKISVNEVLSGQKS